MYPKPDPKKKYIVIWGVERSGTNWLELLLKKNLDANITSYKKHEPRFELDSKFGDNCNFITIIKNPWAWTYSNYIKYKMPVKPRFNGKKQLLKTLEDRIIHYYSHNNESYINLSKKYPKKCLVITYDNLLADEKKVLLEISNKFDIPIKNNFDFVPTIIGPALDIRSKKFDKSFYTQRKYLEKLSKLEKDAIFQNVSKLVMEFCNFEYLSVK